MAITTATAASYKLEALSGGIHLAADVYKIALIKVGHTGTYGIATTNAGTPGTGAPTTANLGTDEVTGVGYTAGGNTLTGFSPTAHATGGRLDFANSAWATATISAVGAVIYNSSKANRVLGVYDFGGTITSTAATFTATMPAVGDATSLVRLT